MQKVENQGQEGLMNTMTQRLGAEFLGTFWLVFGGCGSAVLAAAFPQLGIGFTGVALAFGLTVVTMAYAVGQCAIPRWWIADLSKSRQAA